MNSSSISDQPVNGPDARTALDEFFAVVRIAAQENQAAVDAAKPALARLTPAVAGHENGQAMRVRAILVSLYTGGSVLADVSDLMTLDWTLRRDLCAALLAFGHAEFGYDYLKSAFEQSGDHHAGQPALPEPHVPQPISTNSPGSNAGCSKPRSDWPRHAPPRSTLKSISGSSTHSSRRSRLETRSSPRTSCSQRGKLCTQLFTGACAP